MMDELELQCPHCQSILGIDETGDTYIIEAPALEPNERRGLRGLVTVDATEGWKESAYAFNQQTPSADSPVYSKGYIPRIEEPLSSQEDKALTKAHQTDLTNKGIKSK